MAEATYVDFRTGHLLEVVPRVGFRYVCEGGKLTVPPQSPSGTIDHQLTIGDPDGSRGPQSPTAPRWGGLPLAKVALPLSITSARPRSPARMRIPDSQLPLLHPVRPDI